MAMTLESQDNKTTRCCPDCVEVKVWDGDPYEVCGYPQCECHTPATDDLVEEAITEFVNHPSFAPRYNPKEPIYGNENIQNTVALTKYLRSKLNEVISRTREEDIEEAFEKSAWGKAKSLMLIEQGREERHSGENECCVQCLEDGKEQGIREERERVISKIGLMRQWLNEDRITDKKMVTNEELLSWIIESGKSE